MSALKTKINEKEPSFVGAIYLWIDCFPFYNPSHTRHTGENVNILETLFREEMFSPLLAGVKEQLAELVAEDHKGRKVVFICFCKSGRHRSVAFAAFLRYILQCSGFPTPATMHLSSDRWQDHLCHKGCRDCQASDRKILALDGAWELWKTL
jgi:hypothetical protein